MRPEGESLVLDTRREMSAIEMGAAVPGVDGGDLQRHLDTGAYSKSGPTDPLYGMNPMIGSAPFRNTEAITITPENWDVAVDSLEAVISLGGVAGAKAAVLGRKRVARTILIELDHIQ